MLPIVRAELVWITIPAGGGGAGSTLPFPDVPTLNGVKVTGMEAFDVTQLATTPDRIAVISAADALNVLFTFNEGSDQRIKQQPFTSLQAVLNAGVWKEFEPFQPDWQKSNVMFTAVIAGAAAANISVPFMFYYVREEDAPELFNR